MLANSFEEKSLESLKTKDFFLNLNGMVLELKLFFLKQEKFILENGDNITKSFPDLNVNQNFFLL